MNRVHRDSTTRGPAARLTTVICTLLTAYLGLVALVLAFVWQAPRDTVPLDSEQLEPVFDAMRDHGIALAIAGLATLGLRRVRRLPGAVPKATMLFVLLIGAGSLDRIVGIFFPPPLESTTIFALHPARGWTYRPDSTAPFSDTLMRIDHHGLRVPEDRPPAPIDNKTRISGANATTTPPLCNTPR